MSKIGGRSGEELNLFNHIKDIFPKAHSTFFPNKNPTYVATKFQLDIYIPELRKGIEFDGDYWHSPKGLKRGRPSWTDEQINNYHFIKTLFLKKKGIDIIHIKESEWMSNKQDCLDRIQKFLGVSI
jgi:hypothetical protein